ncbi:MAG: AAA family ATPase [Candidatus Nanopelagicales bacterium]
MVRTIALIGGESSGKTTLASELADSLASANSVAVTNEVLRDFVAKEGRPPNVHEQSAILKLQIQAEADCARKVMGDNDWDVDPGGAFVIADPSVLMTAVYSILYFDDDSLIKSAVRHARGYDLHIWCMGDFEWLPEPGVRDGASFRTKAEQIIDRIAVTHSLDLLKVNGPLENRAIQVEDALASMGM